MGYLYLFTSALGQKGRNVRWPRRGWTAAHRSRDGTDRQTDRHQTDVLRGLLLNGAVMKRVFSADYE